MQNGYVVNLGGVNTPPPNPVLTIGFMLGSFHAFTANLSRPVDGIINIQQVFADSYVTPWSVSTIVGSAQRNTVFSIAAGASGSYVFSDTTEFGDLTTTTNHIWTYNCQINGTTIGVTPLNITVGSYTVKVILVRL